MPLAPGTRLGPYEILAPIGAGGMGEVYRARDTRLGRDIAIKVLPEAFAQDADRLARFEREARAVASLSHPNILAIHDTGTHGGQAYVVTELLEGDSLRTRLEHGGVPVRKAVEIAAQIARGLAAAHGKGIVHRDLKPENVFVLGDGQVKILDFGLARQVRTGSGATETGAGTTDPGVVMGTAGYMAPEQVRGQTADARADLFALGAVLYELLSGQRAFQRDTKAETMTAILKDDPPVIAGSRADLSPALDRIVRHCLEKNPAERFETARDVAFALEALSGSSASATFTATVSPRRSWMTPVALAVLAVAAVAIGMVIDRRLLGAPVPIRFDAKTWDDEWITNARFASDGKTIVFSAALSGSVPELFVVRPDAVVPQRFGQPATHLLSVSSKGELAVLTQAHFSGLGVYAGTLARMTMDGAPRPWLEHVNSADWSPDGSTLAIVRGLDNGRSRLEYPIGETLYETAGFLNGVRVSPDGTQVAFFEHHTRWDDRGWIKIVGRRGTVATLAGEYAAEEGIAWSPDGRSVYFSASTQSGTFNYQVLIVNTSGTPHVRQAAPSAGALWLEDATSDALLTMRLDLRTSIRALIPGESLEREFPWLGAAWHGLLSPDRHALLFTDNSLTAGPNYAVALRKTDGSPAIRLGEGDTLGFSPDGKWAVSQLPSTEQIVLYPIGPGEAIRLNRGPIEHYSHLNPLQWLPKTQEFVGCGNEHGHPPRCYAQDLAGHPPRPITREGTLAAWVALDGQWLLVNTGSGYERVSVDGGARQTTMKAKGFQPGDALLAWSRDGRSIFVQVPGVPVRVERVNPTTGTREFVKELAPPERAGLLGGPVDQWIDDGQGYVYSCSRGLSTLFVVSGVPSSFRY